MTLCLSEERVKQIQDNLNAVRARINAACERVRRAAEEVRLIGVTKGFGPDTVLAAVRAGLKDFGENYAQELVAKVRAVGDVGVRWHFIGGLQVNKVKLIAGLVESVHSVDREGLVRELAKRIEAGRVVDVFVEVNLGGEEQKWGSAPDEVEGLCKAILGEPRLRLVGLMCIPPYSDDPETSRPYFRSLRELRDSLKRRLGLGEGMLDGLSMGMSHDFEVAIEEGATVVRVGTAIFGQRPSKGKGDS